MEHYRSEGKYQQMDDTPQEIPDKVLDLEGMVVSKQCSEQVRKILSELPARDRGLRRAGSFRGKGQRCSLPGHRGGSPLLARAAPPGEI